jgi:1-deoxy-D-xylulose-5-phosphate synthase
MAAADEAELVNMVHTMALHDSGPERRCAYPRGNGTGVPIPAVPERLEIGRGPRGARRQESRHPVARTRLEEAMKAADELEAKGAFGRRLRISVSPSRSMKR